MDEVRNRCVIMPSRLTDERAEAIAQAYCTNGFNKTNGLRSIKKADGSQYYSDGYCLTLGHKLYKNIRVKKAMDSIKAKIAEKVDVTVEFIVEKLLAGLILAEQKGDLVSMARFTELLGRHKAIFTDKYQDTGSQDTPELSTAEVERYKYMAKHLSKGA